VNDDPPRPAAVGPGAQGYDLSDLEPSYRSGLEDVAARERLPVERLLADIDAARGSTTLAEAVRAVVLTYFRIVYEDRSRPPAVPPAPGGTLERAMAVLKDEP
jgi:predicted DNA-binding ribbon-helix-helix protein